jgi:hypothetical protein
MPSTLEIIAYQTMYAFKNHLRVLNAKEHLTTSDSGITSTFEQKCVSRANDQ